LTHLHSSKHRTSNPNSHKGREKRSCLVFQVSQGRNECLSEPVCRVAGCDFPFYSPFFQFDTSPPRNLAPYRKLLVSNGHCLQRDAICRTLAVAVVAVWGVGSMRSDESTYRRHFLPKIQGIFWTENSRKVFVRHTGSIGLLRFGGGEVMHAHARDRSFRPIWLLVHVSLRD
jgi:hypothetical protein